MDDIHSAIRNTFSQEGFINFAKESERFKIVHRCLDGIGLNYTRDKILSIKAYCKILDSLPKFSDEFLKTFGGTGKFRPALLDLCNNSSPCILNRDTGLAGVNIGIKHNTSTGSLTKSIYIKTDPRISHVLNYSEGRISKQKYSYIFNKAQQLILNMWYGFSLPSHDHALEFSRRDTSSFATIYPVFPRKPNQRPSSMHEQYNDLFNDLNSNEEWGIENKILKSCKEHFPLWTPITKGYESRGKSRKMYMGTFSYKHSCFKYF